MYICIHMCIYIYIYIYIYRERDTYSSPAIVCARPLFLRGAMHPICGETTQPYLASKSASNH